MPGSDNRLFKRTNTRIKILIIGEIMKVYDGTLDYILLKVSHLVTSPALSLSERKFTFKASYLPDNTECIITPACAFNGLYSADIKLVGQIYVFLLQPSHKFETPSSQTWLFWPAKCPHIQEGSSFLVQDLPPTAPGYTDSQTQLAEEFAASVVMSDGTHWAEWAGHLAGKTVDSRTGLKGSPKRWFTKKIPFTSDLSSFETIDLTDTKHMGKGLRVKGQSEENQNTNQTNPTNL